MTVAELSRRVHLSKTACQARVRRLETDGYILGYRAVINPKRLGLPHVVFVEVKLSDMDPTHQRVRLTDNNRGRQNLLSCDPRELPQAGESERLVIRPYEAPGLLAAILGELPLE